MKSKKLLTVFLATMLVFSSSVSVFASENNSNSKECKNVSSKNYIKVGTVNKNIDSNKFDTVFKDFNFSKAVAEAKVAKTKPAIAVKACKDVNIVKESVPSKDYNLGKDTNIGSAIRAAQAKAKAVATVPVTVTPPVVISQVLKDQIKAEYTEMRATEVTNKATFVSAVNKKNQVVSYIYKVADGKITYTDAQLTQLDALSTTFEADIKAVTDATVLIKKDEAAVKASAISKNYDAVLVALKTEATDRVARGTALTKVSQDLDAFLLVLVDGQAVLPTPVTPVTEPVVVPAT